jgi:hypothetical protein
MQRPMRFLLAATALVAPASAWGQDVSTGSAPAPVPTEVPAAPGAAPVKDRQVYVAADFARFAPRNAYDMLLQVPGFSIRENEQLRGLGQATGNVLINGERLSSKSDDLATQLTRIPAANVVRIEIVDGATLDLPGLSGQVANIIRKADNFSGQFSWRPQVRAHHTPAVLARGDVSISGRSGIVQYEAGLANDGGSGGAGGPTLIFGPTGAVIERRRDVWYSTNNEPKISGRATIDGPGTSVFNVNAQYQRTYNRYNERGVRTAPGTADRLRTVAQGGDGWNREFGGDAEFTLGPGRLKLIGLDRLSFEPFSQTIVTAFADGATTVGDRYTQAGKLSERIGRGEYSWKLFGADWQLSGEAAYNSLDNEAALFTLDGGGQYVPLPFSDGTGRVDEDRYEGLLSFSRPLSPKLSLQIVAGAEHSTIAQTGPGGLTRSFLRPKGSLSLAWKPSAVFDLSAKLRRRVLQLSFYDFLARVFLDNENANSGNAELVPQQDWTLELEANRRFGAWGSTKVRVIYRDVEDFVDVVPLGLAGQGVGNIAKARAAAIDWTSTIQFDPIGWKGARLDTRVLLQHSRLRDPFTGETRQYSNFTDTVMSAQFRRDLPGSDWAYGGSLEYSHNQPGYRRDQVDRIYEGPVFDSLFVENKDIAGLTVRASVTNLLNARSRRDRTVFTGVRDATPILFVERRDRLIGPIFSLSVRGGF